MSKTLSPTGRLDVLAERLVERIVRQFEADTGLSGLWDAVAPAVQGWTRQTLGPAMTRRKSKRVIR